MQNPGPFPSHPVGKEEGVAGRPPPQLQPLPPTRSPDVPLRQGRSHARAQPLPSEPARPPRFSAPSPQESPGPQPPSRPHLCTQRVARAHAQSRKGAAFHRGRRAASASSPSRRLCGSQPPVTPALPRGPSWPCSSAADAAPDAPLRSFIFKMSLNYLNAQHTRSRETSNTGITEIVPHFIFSHNDCHPVP